MKIRDLDQPQELKDALEEFVRNPKDFIVLSGSNGTGKTYAAKCVYGLLTPYVLPCYDHDIAYFTTQAELNMKWTKCIHDEGHASHLLDIVQKTNLLVLDDLGTREPTAPFMDFLYALSDFRWDPNNGDKGTIITTNLNHADMRQMFGDAFVSRIASNKIFRLDGQDRRRTHKNNA